MFVLPSGVIKNNNKKAGVYIVLYDDDVLLMAPSVDVADQLLKSVERELINLDMVINAKKSCCLRIGPRCNVACHPLYFIWSRNSMER